MAIGDNLEPQMGGGGGMGGGGTQDEIWRMRQQDGTIILVNVSLLGGLQEALRKYPNLAPVSRQANQATVGQLGPGMVAADPFSQEGRADRYVAPTVADPLLSTDPSYSDESQPYGAFTRGLREAGLPTAGFLGDRLRSQYDPLRSLSTAAIAAGTSPTDTRPGPTFGTPLGPNSGDWEQFAAQYGGDRQSARQLAANTLRSLFRRGGGEAGIVDDPRTAAAQAFANPDVGVSFGRLVGAGDDPAVRSSQLANANDMLQLFQQALGNQTSGLLASRLAPKFQQNLLRDFEERITPEQGQVSFGDFFRNRAQDFLGPNFGQPSSI